MGSRKQGDSHPCRNPKGAGYNAPKAAGPARRHERSSKDKGRIVQTKSAANRLIPGQTVQVRQTIHTREGDWQSTVEGKVVQLTPRPTGSWYAHGKDDKLWLQRLRLEKEDGEVVEVNLDRDSIVTIIRNA